MVVDTWAAYTQRGSAPAGGATGVEAPGQVNKTRRDEFNQMAKVGPGPGCQAVAAVPGFSRPQQAAAG